MSKETFKEWLKSYFTEYELENELGGQAKEILSDLYKYQQSKIDKLQQGFKELEIEQVNHIRCLGEAHTEVFKGKIDKLQKKNEILMEAVEFYDNEHSWIRSCDLHGDMKAIIKSDHTTDDEFNGKHKWRGGLRASRALQKIKDMDNDLLKV